MFLAILFSGSLGYFLASAPGNFPPHEIKRVEETSKTRIIFKYLNDIIINLIVNFILLYSIFRKNNEVVVARDNQVSMGNTVVKNTALKIRKIEKRNVVYYK